MASGAPAISGKIASTMRDLISVGAYAAGHDLQLDQAIALYPKIEAFLQQEMHERADFSAATAQLHAILGGG